MLRQSSSEVVIFVGAGGGQWYENSPLIFFKFAYVFLDLDSEGNMDISWSKPPI